MRLFGRRKRTPVGRVPGYRFSDFYGHNSLVSMARVVLKTAPDRFALAGHSMGGRVALEIMRVAPERVERLALFDTSATPAPSDEPGKRHEMIELARHHGMAAVASRWLPMIVHPAKLNQAGIHPCTD